MKKSASAKWRKNEKPPPDLAVEQGPNGGWEFTHSLSQADIWRLQGCRLPDDLLHGNRNCPWMLMHSLFTGFARRTFSGNSNPLNGCKNLARWRENFHSPSRGEKELVNKFRESSAWEQSTQQHGSRKRTNHPMKGGLFPEKTFFRPSFLPWL